MSARDRKLMMILAPLAAFALYWMVLLNPALNRKASLEEPLAQAQTERDAAVAEAEELESAKARYESDYREMVKLVRAIPQSVRVADMMRELSEAADGTGIDFNNISMGAANSDAAASGSDARAASTAALLTRRSARLGRTTFRRPRGDELAPKMLSGVNSTATRATPCDAIQCSGRRSSRRATSESLTAATPSMPTRAKSNAGVPAYSSVEIVTV